MNDARHFPGEPTSIGRARRYVAALLDGLDDALLDPIVVMVSELATNAVRHARTDFTVTVERIGETVRVGVHDEGGGEPRARDARPHEHTGRGLMIVRECSDDWGIEPDGRGGKQVWFTVSLARDGQHAPGASTPSSA